MFKNILVSIDFKTETEQEKINRAFYMAQKNDDIALTFISIAPEFPINPEIPISQSKLEQKIIIKDAEKTLDELVASYQQAMPIKNKIKCVIDVGKPSDAIIRQVIKGEHDLLLVSTRHKKLVDNLLGNTTVNIMRNCPCPIWAVKPEKTEKKKIMIGIHFDEKVSDRNEALNQELIRIANIVKTDSTVEYHLVNVIKDKSDSELYQRNLSDMKHLAEQLSTEVQTVLNILEGDATTLLPQYSDDNDINLLILGMLSRVGLKGFFIGNTAEKILGDVNCSVLTVKPKSFVSPIKIN